MKNARNSSGRRASTLKTFGKKPPLKKESRHVVPVVKCFAVQNYIGDRARGGHCLTFSWTGPSVIGVENSLVIVIW